MCTKTSDKIYTLCFLCFHCHDFSLPFIEQSSKTNLNILNSQANFSNIFPSGILWENIPVAKMKYVHMNRTVSFDKNTNIIGCFLTKHDHWFSLVGFVGVLIENYRIRNWMWNVQVRSLSRWPSLKVRIPLAKNILPQTLYNVLQFSKLEQPSLLDVSHLLL